MLQSSLCVFAAALHEAEERMESMSEGEAEVDPRHGWRHLPPELLYEVFSILSLADLLTVNSVCKFWKVWPTHWLRNGFGVSWIFEL